MTVSLIDNLTEWLQTKICNELQFKKASMVGDRNYKYELVNPTAFPCFCPPQDKTNLPVSPSVTVQVDGIADDLDDESVVNVALVFSVWNPGEHDNSGETPRFTKNLDGWRDLWRFIDKTRKGIRHDLSIAGYRLINGTMNARPLSGESAIMGTYPYYFGEITFALETIESTATSRNEDIRNLL
jgi:hypothetical protein